MTTHPLQIQILSYLKSVPSARFNDLKPKEITSDHFNFHIKRLIELGIIKKTEDGLYVLTTEGKALANKIDDTKTPTNSNQIQPKTSLLFVISQEFDGIEKFVVKKRVQHPFMNHLVFPTWGLEFGMPIQETIDRYLPFTTGLNLLGKPEIIGHIRRIDRDTDQGKVINDILLLITRVREVSGELREDHKGAPQFWVTKDEMLANELLTGVPPHVFEMLENPLAPRLVELDFDINSEQF